MTRRQSPHGTSNRYARGCRCTPCTKAASRADAERKLDRLAGRPRQVPAATAAAHMRKLRERGLTPWQIARESGVDPTTVSAVLNGRREVLRKTEEAILAVPLDVRVSLGDVPALGATRRLQALYALGHRRAVIAEAAGISQDAVTELAAGRWASLRVAADDGVRAAYAQLSMAAGSSWVSQRHAAKNGWAPPLAWDDDSIDDPEATPLLGAAGEGDAVDEVAVRRYARGDRVAVTDEERLAAIATCVAQELAYSDIDALHGYGSTATSVFVARMRRSYARDGRRFPEALSQSAVRELTECEVVAIRTRAQAGATDLELALAHGVRARVIAEVCRGRTYQQYGGPIRDAKKGPSMTSKTVFAKKTGQRAA